MERVEEAIRRARGASAATLAATGVVAASGIVSGLIASRVIPPGNLGAFAAALASVVTSTVAAFALSWRRLRRSPYLAVASPLTVAGATWIVLFVLRPIDLYFSPEHAVQGLAQLGFDLGDLTRTVAIGGLGCAVCWLAYLPVLPADVATDRAGGRAPVIVSLRRVALALGIAVPLWLVLFAHSGGLTALRHSAASIRTHQLGGGYGFVGAWMIEATGLYALAVALRTKERRAWQIVWLVLFLSLLILVTLQVRALLVTTVIAGLIMYVAARGVRRRYLVAGACIAVAAALALAAFQQVRAYSSTMSTGQAFRLTLKTPPAVLFASDLSTYDQFVAIEELVPGSIAYLGGKTLLEAPASLVPTAIWRHKPRSIDFLVASYLYPGVFVATPITIQGELYWNGGLAFVVLGSIGVGLLLGLLARVGLRAAPTTAPFVAYALLLSFVHGFATRGLGAMIENVVFALVGLGAAVVVLREPHLVGWALGMPRRWLRAAAQLSSAAGELLRGAAPRPSRAR